MTYDRPTGAGSSVAAVVGAVIGIVKVVVALALKAQQRLKTTMRKAICEVAISENLSSTL